MPEKIVVPVLGESITEATVSKWLKSKGDTVEADEPIVELETDKVNLEVPSPSGGILGEINFEAGSTVEVGTTLGSIMGGQSVAKTDKIEKIKAETESLTNGNDNIIKLDEERDTKLFDNTIEPEIIKNQLDEEVNQEPKEDPLILTEEVKNEESEKRGKKESR